MSQNKIFPRIDDRVAKASYMAPVFTVEGFVVAGYMLDPVSLCSGVNRDDDDVALLCQRLEYFDGLFYFGNSVRKPAPVPNATMLIRTPRTVIGATCPVAPLW